MTPLISVIIPVYNAEAFIERCIESVCKQTYKNIEIIAIDDGSTDRSWEILLELSKSDSRIKLHKKTNSGSADTRNFGIGIAQGEYIGFIDADDWIANDMYEKMYSAIVQHKADMAVCETMDCGDDGTRKIRNTYKTEVLSNEKAMEKVMLTQCSVWNKLYKKEIIKNVVFPNMRRAEDGPFMFRILAQNVKVIFLDEALYYCYYHVGSLSHATFGENSWCVWEAGNYLYDEISRYSNALNDLAVFRYFAHCNILLREMSVSPKLNEILKDNSDKLDELKKKARKLLKQIFTNPLFSKSMKIVGIMVAVNPKIFIWWIRRK